MDTIFYIWDDTSYVYLTDKVYYSIAGAKLGIRRLKEYKHLGTHVYKIHEYKPIFVRDIANNTTHGMDDIDDLEYNILNNPLYAHHADIIHKLIQYYRRNNG